MQSEPTQRDPAPEAIADALLDGLSDAELLDRFIRHQDDVAFAFLVERHGPMVRGLCQRMLRDPNAVDDAFQVTFLILVRKAASLGKPELLANWLYGVAFRTALNARTQAARRSHHESEAAAMSPPSMPPSSAPADSRQELLAALDEALESLPEKFRAPLILCYLEGKTNEQAAQILGWPTGSISARLARGRAMLRDRLVGRYGDMLTGFLVAVLAEHTRASAVPPRLAGATVQAARGMLQGDILGVKLTSPSVDALMDETLHSMSVARLKRAIGLFLVFALTAGVSFAMSTGVPGFSQGPKPASVSPTSAENPAAKVRPNTAGGAACHP